jgi:hypothetical protein
MHCVVSFDARTFSERSAEMHLHKTTDRSDEDFILGGHH